MKKFVLNLDLQNDKEQQRRALKTVSTLSGIDEISMDLKGKKLTVIGTVDPVSVVSKLRKKSWPTAQIVSVGPAKEPEKKEEPKKEEPKKEEPKKEEELKKVEAKEEPKKEEAKKEEAKEEPKKEEAKKEEEKKPEPEIVPGMMAPMPGMMTSMPGMMTAMPGTTPMPYRPYRQYYPPMPTYYPVHHSVEENPNACVIS